MWGNFRGKGAAQGGIVGEIWGGKGRPMGGLCGEICGGRGGSGGIMGETCGEKGRLRGDYGGDLWGRGAAQGGGMIVLIYQAGATQREMQTVAFVSLGRRLKSAFLIFSLYIKITTDTLCL